MKISSLTIVLPAREISPDSMYNCHFRLRLYFYLHAFFAVHRDALRRHVAGEPNCYQYLASINQLPEGLSSTHSSSSSISSNGTPHIQPPPRTSSLNSRRSSSNSNAAAVSPTPAPILFDFTSHPALATQNILSPGLEMQNLHLNSQPSSPALPLSSNMNQTNAMGGAGLEYGNYFGIDPNMIQTPTNNIDMSLLMNMGINGGTNSADMMTLLSMANNGTPDTLSSDVINLDMSEIEKLFGEMNNQGLYPNPQQTATTNSSMSDLTLLNGAGSQGYASSDTLNQLSGNAGNLPLDTLEITEEQLKMLLNEGYGGQLNGLGHGNVNGKGTTNGSVLGTSIGNNQV
ncbi:hypothetical protein BKA69DRAFT_19318 [Paraphysoderma sedebokerense]|nr:hypothetical protein BKA69DRAFT_19318 [Paraphysoderma sedebokerense]